MLFSFSKNSEYTYVLFDDSYTNGNSPVFNKVAVFAACLALSCIVWLSVDELPIDKGILPVLIGSSNPCVVISCPFSFIVIVFASSACPSDSLVSAVVFSSVVFVSSLSSFST